MQCIRLHLSHHIINSNRFASTAEQSLDNMQQLLLQREKQSTFDRPGYIIKKNTCS